MTLDSRDSVIWHAGYETSENYYRLIIQAHTKRSWALGFLQGAAFVAVFWALDQAVRLYELTRQ